MKKVTALMMFGLLVLVLAGCSKDGDAVDPLIGEWQFNGIFANGNSVPQLPCTFENKILFEEEGVGSILAFGENPSTGDCFLDEELLIRWSAIDDSNYRVSASSFLEPIVVINDEVFDVLFFERDNNDLSTTIQLEDNNTYVLRYRKQE
jgi:hypothetical protein